MSISSWWMDADMECPSLAHRDFLIDDLTLSILTRKKSPCPFRRPLPNVRSNRQSASTATSTTQPTIQSRNTSPRPTHTTTAQPQRLPAKQLPLPRSSSPPLLANTKLKSICLASNSLQPSHSINAKPRPPKQHSTRRRPHGRSRKPPRHQPQRRRHTGRLCQRQPQRHEQEAARQCGRRSRCCRRWRRRDRRGQWRWWGRR